MLHVEQFMCRDDNFGLLVHDPASGHSVLIDAPEEAQVLAAIERTGWSPSLLLTTHHHADHVAANLALKQRYGLEIIGPEREADKIPGLDRPVRAGTPIPFGNQTIEVIETPGHTAGHVSYHFPGSSLLFVGDTLFALGCGRLFECPPSVMLQSLRKLMALAPATTIYCGHEYTQSNARFARTIDPGNAALVERAALIDRLREAGEPTLPTTLELEMATNPFLRCHDPAIRRNLMLQDASDEAVFAEIRRRKDMA